MCQLRKGGRRGDIIQNKPPGSGACFELDRVSSGVGRHSAGNSNDLSGVSAHGKIQESLGCLGELGALLGDHNEGTLDLIGAVLHGDDRIKPNLSENKNCRVQKSPGYKELEVCL